jgi:putative flippase GtrA
MLEKLKNIWFNLSDKIRFILVGCFNTGVSYIIYSLICFWAGEQYYQASLATAWIISSAISFTTQRCFVFNVKGNLFKQYFKCCTTWFFSYIINATLLEIFVQKLQINVYVSQILATGICAIFTYILFKTFAFRRNS